MAARLGKALSRIGFTEKQRRAYIALLDGGAATARELAERADMSREHAYNTIDALEERALVSTTNGRPVRVRPNPPEVVEAILAEERHIVASGVRRRLDDGTDGDTRLTDPEAVLDRVRDQIRSAHEEVLVSLPASVYPDVAGALREARDRDALVLLLLTGSTGDIVNARRRGFDGVASVVQVCPDWLHLLVAVDGRVGVFAPQDLFVEGPNRSGAVLRKPALNSHVGFFLDSYWYDGEEVRVADPVDLPTTYARSRPAVFEATLHRRARKSVSARVVGRSTDDDERVVVDGEVVDVYQRLLDPYTTRSVAENTLLVRDGDREVSVGPSWSSYPDVAARRIELSRPG